MAIKEEEFDSLVELVDYYKQNIIIKLKPNKIDIQRKTGRNSEGKFGGFLGPEGTFIHYFRS